MVMRLLSATDIAELFTMPLAIEAARIAAVAYVQSRTEVPTRSNLRLVPHDGEVLVMPGVFDGRHFAVKTWFRFEGESTSATQTQAYILYIDASSTSQFLLDGTGITDFRTGALTAVAAQYLAPSGSETVAIVGAGAQARTQALALVESIECLRQIRVASRSPQRLKQFVAALSQELESRQVEVCSVSEVREAVADADIVVAATTSTSPVVEDSWIKSNALVCGVGSHNPFTAEIDPATVARARLVVADTRAGGVDGSGDLLGPVNSGLITRSSVIELGDLILQNDVKRQSDEGISVFKSVGFAAVDVVASAMTCSAAVSSGKGRLVELNDVADPSPVTPISHTLTLEDDA